MLQILFAYECVRNSMHRYLENVMTRVDIRLPLVLNLPVIEIYWPKTKTIDKSFSTGWVDAHWVTKKITATQREKTKKQLFLDVQNLSPIYFNSVICGSFHILIKPIGATLGCGRNETHKIKRQNCLIWNVLFMYCLGS